MSYLDEDKSMTLRQWLGLEPVSDRPKIRWWRPPARDVLRQITWRWLLALPAAVSLSLFIAGDVSDEHRAFFLYMGVKLLVISAALPVLTWDYYRQRAIRARPDPFCPHCGWTLIGLPEEGRCPECGEPFRRRVVEMYRRDPHWVRAYWEFEGRAPSTRSFNLVHPYSIVGEE